MPQTRPSILVIAGFDPTAGAGILADAAIMRSLGFHPLVVLTSVAAQNAAEVAEIRSLPKTFIQRQMQMVLSEFQPAAIKIGMLYSAAAVEIALDLFKTHPLPSVLDPVIWSSSGRKLIQRPALNLLEKHLLPQVRMVTPNSVEAGYFLRRKISNVADAQEAATELSLRWKTAVLLKGGHLDQDPVDILAEGEALWTFKRRRQASGVNLRGTGCALSSAIAIGLAQGLPLLEAVKFGGQAVEKAIENYYLSSSNATVGFLGDALTGRHLAKPPSGRRLNAPKKNPAGDDHE